MYFVCVSLVCVAFLQGCASCLGDCYPTVEPRILTEEDPLTLPCGDGWRWLGWEVDGFSAIPVSPVDGAHHLTLSGIHSMFGPFFS